MTTAAKLAARLDGFFRSADGGLPDSVAGADRDFMRDILVCGGVMFVATLAVYLGTINWASDFPRDSSTLVVGRDFMNFWIYGQAAFSDEPGRFYDPRLYHAHLASVLGPDHPRLNWSYPPSIMLLAAPFGQIGYFPALLVWTLLGLAVFVPVALAYARSLGIADARLLLPVLLSPAAVFCLISGQSSFFTAALLIGAFLCLDRRPALAGLLIGLLTLKPQLGLLFPLMLIVTGRWRVFGSAAVTTLALAGASAVVLGPEAWGEFISKGLPVQNVVLSDPKLVATPFYPTVFMNIRGLDLPYAVAIAGQLPVSLFAAGAVAWAFYRRREADPVMLLALFLVASVSFSPYLLAYDLLPATFAAILLLAFGRLDAAGRRLAQLLYWTPALQLALGALHVPGPALIPPAVLLYLVLKLRADAPVRAAGGMIRGTAAR